MTHHNDARRCPLYRHQLGALPEQEGPDTEDLWARGRASLISDGSGTRYVTTQTVLRLPTGPSEDGRKP